MEGPLNPPIMRGLRQAAAGRVRLVIHGFPSHYYYHKLCAPVPLENLGYDPSTLDGTISFFGEPPLLDWMERLHASGHPCITVLRPVPSIPHIVSDDSPAIAALVRHFACHGHTRIAILSGPTNQTPAKARLAGYRAGLEEAGLPYSEDLVFPGQFIEAPSYKSVIAALDRGVRFTALIGTNDLSAFGALRALDERGVRVPADVELAGFDNLPTASLCNPPLSTFVLPLREMAYTAVMQMHETLRGKAPPARVALAPRFIARASTRSTESDPFLGALPGKCADTTRVAPSIAELIDSLPPDSPLATVLAVAGKSFFESTRLNHDIEPVSAAIAQRFSPPASPEIESVQRQQALASALSLTLDTARITHAQAVERSQAFQALTFRLRQLALESPQEESVLEILGETLSALGIREARLLIKESPSECAPDTPARLHSWTLPHGGRGASVPATPRDTQPAALGILDQFPAVFTLPLIAHVTVLGTLVVDGSSRFSDDIAELARNLASALQSVRLYRDLAKTNDNLRATQRELIEVSRHAGIAEIATGILHNIGNALNSVNTSAGVITDELDKMKIDSVARIAALLTADDEAWRPHFADDPRGRKTVDFIRSLHAHLHQTRGDVLREIRALRDGVDHVNQVVAAQQQFAHVSGVVEDFDLFDAADYALRLCETELLRHQIVVERDYQSAPRVRLERHKAVQIIVNLIRNAKDALSHAPSSEKRLRVGVRTAPDGRAQCFVADNGVGISPENLGRVFSMGFTTKKSGHGFGLHNSALTASSLGGTLTVESAGLGEGATFILTLPPSAS